MNNRQVKLYTDISRKNVADSFVFLRFPNFKTFDNLNFLEMFAGITGSCLFEDRSNVAEKWKFSISNCSENLLLIRTALFSDFQKLFNILLAN